MWTRYKGGWGWRVDRESGHIIGEHKPQAAARLVSFGVEPGYLYRTRGNPSSMRTLWDDFGEHVEEASDLFAIPPQFIMACIGIEAVPGGKRPDGSKWRWNPRSCRYESHIDDSSPGLMQTLTRTADSMRRKFADVLPDIPAFELGGQVRSSDDHALFDPRWSILLGTAYMRHQMDRVEDDERDLPHDDPVLNIVAAYNAGSVRSADNVWNLRTYSPTRIDRFLAWNNDSVAVLDDLGVWTGYP